LKQFGVERMSAEPRGECLQLLDLGQSFLQPSDPLVCQSQAKTFEVGFLFRIIRGEVLLLQNQANAAEAERCFRAAIQISQRQSAKMSELSATTELARLLAPRGRRDEARAMLGQIYNWFTEGFETRYLKEAKALLEVLHN
jgi:hypothetical protein